MQRRRCGYIRRSESRYCRESGIRSFHSSGSQYHVAIIVTELQSTPKPFDITPQAQIRNLSGRLTTRDPLLLLSREGTKRPTDRYRTLSQGFSWTGKSQVHFSSSFPFYNPFPFSNKHLHSPLPPHTVPHHVCVSALEEQGCTSVIPKEACES